MKTLKDNGIIVYSGVIFLSILKYMFTPNHPSISGQYRHLKLIVSNVHVTILTREQLKRLRKKRIADKLNNSPFLEDCRSFDARLWLLHDKQNPSLVSMLVLQLVSHLQPAETANMGYFSVGPITNIVQWVCLYLCGKFDALLS